MGGSSQACRGLIRTAHRRPVGTLRNSSPTRCRTGRPDARGHSATATDRRFDGDAIGPVCGYRLDLVPWLGASASHRTCPSGGTRFGFHDLLSGGDPHLLAVEHERLRGRWLELGKLWRSETPPEPPGWDPERQLLALR